MVDPAASLDATVLRRLRQLVQELHAHSGNGLARAQLVQLAAELGLPAGLTVDFAASRELGQPLIVLRPAQRSPACFDRLSSRELQVAALLAAGLPNKDIARRLCISLATVKDHVHRILAKTGLASRAEVMAAYWGVG